MADTQRVNVEFSSDAFDSIADDLFKVVGFSGVEAISQPFEFNISLLSAEPDLDLQELVGQNATLTLSRDTNSRDIHGVIFSIEQGEETQFGQYLYYAVLVPRIYMMRLNQRNLIYQALTVPDIVQLEMLDGQTNANLEADDLDNRLSRSYPAREYLVQYNETDLNFISRLMEHEGIYYYFDHSDNRDKLILCDEKNQIDDVIPENQIPYVPASGLASFDDEAIHKFTFKRTQTSSQVALRDYNYSSPDSPITGDGDVDQNNTGVINQYGDHFKNNDEGNDLAEIRAQEELSKQNVCVGTSDALNFSAGYLMEMNDHFRSDFNQQYLIIRIEHRGGQALPGVSASNDNNDAIAYRNDFEAIPSTLEFRPTRIAKKTKLYGVLNAFIDGAEDSERAQIDDKGRYKVIMPFDTAGQPEGSASHWIRKAESYGGKGNGTHFPLLKGTEVIWSCIDGDPDRPIITGVVYNPHNINVVTSANNTRNITKTPSDIQFIVDDGPEGSSVEKMYSISVPDYNGLGDYAYLRMGRPDNSSYEVEAETNNDDNDHGIVMLTKGSIKQKSKKSYFSSTSGITYKRNWNLSGKLDLGYSSSIKIGGATNLNASYDLTVGTSANVKVNYGADISINYGIKFSAGSTKEFKNVSGPLVQQAKAVLIRASEYNAQTTVTDKNIGRAAIGAGGAAIASGSAAALASPWDDTWVNTTLLSTSFATSAASVAAAVAYAKRKIKHEQNELASNGGKESFIAIDNDSISISCDGSSIVINGEGVFINGKTFAVGQLPQNKATFKPKDSDLEHAKVAKVYPEYITMNAKKQVHILAKQSVYLNANEKLKFQDDTSIPFDENKRKVKKPAPPVPKGGFIQLSGNEAKQTLNLTSAGSTQIESKKDLKITAKSTFSVDNKNVEFTKNITAKGTIKDKNIRSS